MIRRSNRHMRNLPLTVRWSPFSTSVLICTDSMMPKCWLSSSLPTMRPGWKMSTFCGLAAIYTSKYRSLEEKREQINAVFYLVKTGCQWRNLPKDFPKWKTVYSFYRRACLNGIWDKIQKALVKKVRLAKGKKETPSYALIDSQSAKTVSSNEKRGYDGGKKRKEEKDT